MNIYYDYTDDTLGNKNMNEKGYKEYLEKKGFDKYLEYRLSKNSKKDPDLASKKLQEVYKEKWKRYQDPRITSVYSDTMTSAQALISHYYLEECAEEWEHYKKQFSCPKAKYPSAISMNNIVGHIKEYPKFKKIFMDETEEKYQCVREFISLYHTIGNYIPVPEYFNSNRSGNYANHDMWDLTLLKISDYFKFREDKNEQASIQSLKELLHLNVDNTTNRCVLDKTKHWLDSFQDWKEFIRENYLQDYVDLEHDWIIKKEFTDIHTWENPFPEGNYLTYFELLTKVIKARGNNILLGKKVKDETR